ncbi:Uncharacterised protein [Mycobacterium tuberculosis]|uniref:Uncharacterized protein n=1 Tax=Mycobacterium tuberculosis TaxID=1773 RepID=A0A654U8J3_MYCTX|nr:Uncharacterised protein [Mycobacterium tuberculosis]
MERQCPRDADALLLTAGELGGITTGVAVAQSDDIEQLGDPRVSLVLAEPIGLQWFGNQIEDRQPRV